MRRVFSYASTVDTTGINGLSFYAYSKFIMRTNHRNALMMLVPKMYVVSKGTEREFLSERFNKITLGGEGKYSSEGIVEITTIPRRKKAMDHMTRYITPSIYLQTMFGGNVLSPFHRENQRFYRYRINAVSFGKAEIRIIPVNKNTQLLEGTAVVEVSTGKVLRVNLMGERDMTRYHLEATMGSDGIFSIIPKECTLDFRFSLLKNRISGRYKAVFDIPNPLPDSIHNSRNDTLMEKVRPVNLDWIEEKTIEHYAEKQRIKDSIAANKPEEEKNKKNFAKDVLWDMIGENLLDDIKSNFGNNNQGNFRIKPILNPLYMGYSKSKGIYYKFDARGSYIFNENWQLSLRFKASYMFKHKQLYYRIPATLNFNKKHNGYLRIEIGNGNRITNSRVVDAIKEQKKDSIHWAGLGLKYFKDYNNLFYVHYDLSSRFGFETGFSYHRRSAVNKDAHEAAGMETTYRSAAPTLRLIYRPWGYKGMIIAADYERSFHNLLNSNMAYERLEFDVQHILRLKRMNTLKWRFGTGFYTSRSGSEYFLDYTNFRDDNIPGGWDDEWTGEFELLDRNWYNASEYYIRANLTFETPMLVLAWLPIAGRFIERERIYVSALDAQKLHPYVECGYGFTTRLLSVGLFTSVHHFKFDEFGVKLGFELFRQW